MIDGYESPGQTKTYQMGTMFKMLEQAEKAVLEAAYGSPKSQSRILNSAKASREDIPSSFIKHSFWRLVAKGILVKEGNLYTIHV